MENTFAIAKRARWLPHYVKLFRELVGWEKDWPRRLRNLIIETRHLRNQDRFTVVVFLLANGVGPDILRQFFDRCFNFDRAAWSQIEWVITNYPNKSWKAWNVALQRSI